MDRTNYDSKMMELLSNGRYKVLKLIKIRLLEMRRGLKKVFQNGHLDCLIVPCVWYIYVS